MNGLPGPGNTQGHGVIERTADDHIVYWIEIDNSKGFAYFDKITENRYLIALNRKVN